jgi:transcriptional regulator with XRE-family HTH domain
VPKKNAMRALVMEVMGQASRKAGKQRALLNQIEPLIGNSFETNSVSAWVRGRNMPGADVLLAAAKANGISLDELLFGESLLSRQDRLEKELGDLRQAISGRASSLDDGPR